MKNITLILLLFCTSSFAQKPYNGAEVYSKESVLYGKFEMRMKMIKGSGMLSTFYTIKHYPGGNDPYWGELDIEVLGKNNAQIMSTNIFANDNDGNLVYSEEQIPLNYSLADDFHVFTLEWTPDYIAWFIDGVEQRRKTGAFVTHMDRAQGYRFNAWISSTPAWVGAIDESAMPAYQYVDWIEYSSYDPSNQSFTKQWRDEFDSFDYSRWTKAQWTFNGNEVDFVRENAYVEAGNLVLAITNPDAPLSISDETKPDAFSVKYLHGHKEIHISNLKGGNYDVQLHDLNGKILLSNQFNTSKSVISCPTIPSGLYIISVYNEMETFRKKIFIR
ncbi:family 16 glycosylhydrolase [Tamlana sp. 2_MG-2023]|uniref:family 16 glycosylhydrolase n=1 Tax=unclassified Tamlana TaxID=2614803 RepID=UPI0026E12C43|nr:MULTISPECIES: family 16 glycosylhydrolase [unclassified Tamlana]MDO6760006.1 family 16 glycosylhydrolase [Tamlana sp. 2_MG-2023]MDO6791824.1 family 16 glycosylhydrolase [Tamlana sp. 1_MG-2023]